MAKSSNALKKITSNIKKYQPKSFTPVLAILLVVAAFLLGVLFTKVQYLEKGQGTGTTVTADAGQDNGQPTLAEKVDVKSGHLPVLGNKDAKVTVVEFSDFQCPFCKSLFDDSLSQLKKDYIDTGKIAFYYRHFPLTAIHPNAQKAAEAAECANEQGSFWQYHDQLFTNQADWESLSSALAVDKFAEIATSIGLNGASLKSCVDSDKYAAKVEEDVNDGSAAGLSGTPTTFVNGYSIVGAVPYSQIKAKIDEELAN